MAHSAVAVATEEELAKHHGRHLVEIEGRYVALVAHAGRVYAIDATCYHMGGPLLHADIEDTPAFGPCVVCPWHRYPISLETGDSLYRNMQGVSCSKGVKQRVHHVERRDGKIFVQLRMGEADKVESDTYAFKPPPPSGGGGIGGGGGVPRQQSIHSGGVVRSGQVLGQGAPTQGWLARGRGVGGAKPLLPQGSTGVDVARSMSGADGRAPWASASSATGLSLATAAVKAPDGFDAFVVESRRPIASDAVELTVSGDLPGPSSSWTSGAHLMVRLSSRADDVERPYTPYRRPGVRGQFQLLVKSYPNGALSSKLARLVPGAKLFLRGPLSGAPFVNSSKGGPLVFITGGTGITPVLQVLFSMVDDVKAVACASAHQPTIHVLCYGHRPEDLYLRRDLEALTQVLPGIHLHFSATHLEGAQASEWTDSIGRPSLEAFRERLPSRDSGARIFWCGPPAFNDTVRSILSEIGFTDDQVHEYS